MSVPLPRTFWMVYGAEIAVPKMSAAEHKAIDPITELQAMAPNAKAAIAVVVDPASAEVRQ